MKSLVKRALHAVAPQATTAWLSARARAQSHRRLEELGFGALNRKLVAALGTEVLTGPFRGMTLTPMAHKENLGPFLLGTYEAELHGWIAELKGRSFAQVLDVGSRFGFYAVGLARLFPGSAVVAFDTDWWARKATREMARANGVASVEVRGFCDPTWLDEHLRPGALILSDCEGYERTLLCGATTPALDSATILVELHEVYAPGVTVAIRDRFAATHDARSVANADRSAPPVDLNFLTPEEVAAAHSENRAEQEWLLLTPRDSGSSRG
jgi:hypothetical protein